MRATARTVQAKAVDPVERELAELGEECARVVLLLQRLAKARVTNADASEILGEVSATVLHLNVLTKGLDKLIDDLESE